MMSDANRDDETKCPPMWNSKILSYDDWKFEVKLWNEFTKIGKTRRGR